jgi:2-keto-4-pentenoate hydratase/2-oxohepta-3-ene-1,7-dioic acid hydratase in catechol pathway
MNRDMGDLAHVDHAKIERKTTLASRSTSRAKCVATWRGTRRAEAASAGYQHRQMIFTLAEQIAQLSSRITLYPGDVILTGTPAGVGAGRGEFLKPGDVVKLWIEKIGTLTNAMA